MPFPSVAMLIDVSLSLVALLSSSLGDEGEEEDAETAFSRAADAVNEDDGCMEGGGQTNMEMTQG